MTITEPGSPETPDERSKSSAQSAPVRITSWDAERVPLICTFPEKSRQGRLVVVACHACGRGAVSDAVDAVRILALAPNAYTASAIPFDTRMVVTHTDNASSSTRCVAKYAVAAPIAVS